MSDRALSGLFEVVSNPYWQRAWIIQEVAVARKVVLVCGSKRTSWDALVQALARWDVWEWARPISSGSNFPGREIRTIDNFRTERHGPLIEVLQKTRSSRATNPLDVVYAKLGLANDAPSLVSRISYGIDVSTLFKTIVKRYIMTKYDLNIICLVREGQESGSHLPSWTPDWTKSTNRYPLLRFFFSGWLNILHASHQHMEVSFSNDLNEMRVRGLILDTLGRSLISKSRGKPLAHSAQGLFPSICRAALAAHFVLPRQNDWWTMPAEFIDLFATTAAILEDEDQAQYTSARQTLHTALYATSTAEDTAMSTPSLPWDLENDSAASKVDDFRQWYQLNRDVGIAGQTVAEWAKMYRDASSLDNESGLGSPPLSTGGIERSLTAMAANRKLVGTISGRPALVPEAATDGDILCSLYGCPVPVLLRASKRHHLFIGECFVEDFIDERQDFGTGLKPLKETIFHIR